MSCFERFLTSLCQSVQTSVQKNNKLISSSNPHLGHPIWQTLRSYIYYPNQAPSSIPMKWTIHAQHSCILMPIRSWVIPALDILSDIQHCGILVDIPIRILTDICYCIRSYDISATSSVTAWTHIPGTRPQTDMSHIKWTNHNIQVPNHAQHSCI